LERAEKSSLRKARLARHAEKGKHVRKAATYTRLVLLRLTQGACVRRKRKRWKIKKIRNMINLRNQGIIFVVMKSPPAH